MPSFFLSLNQKQPFEIGNLQIHFLTPFHEQNLERDYSEEIQYLRWRIPKNYSEQFGFAKEKKEHRTPVWKAINEIMIKHNTRKYISLTTIELEKAYYTIWIPQNHPQLPYQPFISSLSWKLKILKNLFRSRTPLRSSLNPPIFVKAHGHHQLTLYPTTG